MFALPAKNCVRTLGIAIAVLAAAACSPSRAAAECGDHVRIQVEEQITDDNGKTESQYPKPCDGPTCSKRQTPPAAPLSVPPSTQDFAKSFAELLAHDMDGSTSVRLAALEQLLIPDPVASSIFHPPRS